jgi:hypothetical protein
MKWPIEPIGRKDDTRTLTKYAWHPVRLDTDQAVWLERYRVLQRVQLVRYSIFESMEWVTIEKLPMEPASDRWTG